jgi:hypothetical protein
MQETSSKSSDDSIDFLIIVCIAMIVVFFLLRKYDYGFLGLWKTLYLPQAVAIAGFSKTFLGKIINSFLGHAFAQTQSLPVFISKTPVHDLNWSFCWQVSGFLGKYLLLVLVPLGGYVTFKTYQNTQGGSPVYKRFKNAEEFLCFARKHFLEKERGINKPQNVEGPKKPFYPANFPGSLSPLNFATKNQLLKTNSGIYKSNHIDDEKTLKCFVEQLGEPFEKIEVLMNRPYGWVVSKIMNFIPLEYRVKAIKEASEGHFYDSTVLLCLLEIARQYGVVSNMLFVSLKQSNSALWYGLMNVGRNAVFLEGAGISSQYEAEKNAILEKFEENKKQHEKNNENLDSLSNPFKSMDALLTQPYGTVVSRVVHYIPEEQREEVITKAISGHFYDATVIISLLKAARKYAEVPKKIFTSLKKSPGSSISSSEDFSHFLWEAIIKEEYSGKKIGENAKEKDEQKNEILERYFYEKNLKCSHQKTDKKDFSVQKNTENTLNVVDPLKSAQAALEGLKEIFYNNSGVV